MLRVSIATLRIIIMRHTPRHSMQPLTVHLRWQRIACPCKNLRARGISIRLEARDTSANTNGRYSTSPHMTEATYPRDINCIVRCVGEIASPELIRVSGVSGLSRSWDGFDVSWHGGIFGNRGAVFGHVEEITA